MSLNRTPSTLISNDPVYLVVHSSAFAAEHAQYFSPRLMMWNDASSPKDTCVWIFDITRCHSYWQIQATQAGLSLYELFLKALNKICGESNFQATLGDHPWRGILLLKHMQSKQLKGLLDYRLSFSRAMIQQVSWPTWWESISELETHLSRSNFRNYKQASFKRHCLQMKRAAERMNLRSPYELKAANSSGIQRRFGGLLQSIWRWSFLVYDCENTSANTAIRHQASLFAEQIKDHDTGEFPWTDFEFKSLPQIKTNLDYGLREWQQIEPILREDFDRLCRSANWTERDKLVSLEWRLAFDDMTSHPVSLQFRHPHCLHREMGHHRTALLQAYYSFSSDHRARMASARQGSESLRSLAGNHHHTGAMIGPFQNPTNKTSAPPDRGDNIRYIQTSDRPPNIIGWELLVTQVLVTPPFMTDLFGTGNCQAQELIDLENRIGVPLESYALRSDWQPENSYQRTSHLADQELSDETELYQSVTAAARLRPLFYYAQPQACQRDGQSSAWQFLERTMSKWWNLSPPNGTKTMSSTNKIAAQRDYYRMLNHKNQALWVFKDSHGNWYTHGIFA